MGLLSTKWLCIYFNDLLQSLIPDNVSQWYKVNSLSTNVFLTSLEPINIVCISHEQHHSNFTEFAKVVICQQHITE